MKYEQIVENAVRATDLQDLLDHIAWEQTVAPALAKYKENYQKLLVQAVLGQQIVDQATGHVISKEMLAGRIEGIDWITKYMVHVLKRGDAAKADLSNYEVTV